MERTNLDINYYGRVVKIRPNQTTLSYHADHVAMIAVGNNGIARGSKILSCYSHGGAESYIDWLLDEEMNVANGSFGGVENYGVYASQSKIMDSYIHDYLFTFVAAAGNKTYDENNNIINDNYVTWPATGFNVVTVGNSGNDINYIYSSSCYKELDGYKGSKPNISAPGTTTTNSYNAERKTYSGTGTSYAAPQATGCIALLMEEFPYLIAYPELVTSIITASASPMSSTYNSNSNSENVYDTSGLHNRIGSGLLNYEKMREAANQYLSITVPKSKSSYRGLLDQYLEFRVPSNKRIRASLAWLANGTDENNFTDYDLCLMRVYPDESEKQVMRITGTGNNVEFLDYAVDSGGLFRLKINKYGASNQTDFLGLSYFIIDDNGGSKSGGNVYTVNTLGELPITTTDYASFGGVYNNSAISSTLSVSNKNVKTKRLRAAIVEDHLVLSAKNKDAGVAYLEYEFDYYINSLEFNFGLWSDNESLI